MAEMLPFLFCLSMAMLHPSWALSWQGQKPVILGTQRLDPAEQAGLQPIFVDAFLNRIGGSSPPAWGARILLSYGIIHQCPPKAPKGCLREKWDWHALHWSCRWHEPSLSLARHTGLEEEAEVMHDSGRPNSSVSIATTIKSHSYWMHQALVVACRLPQELAHLKEWKLDVTASLGKVQFYSRKGIPLRHGAFVREGTPLALCTMVNSADDLLWPWAKFHAQAGFKQILIYVEQPDIRPVAAKLKDLIDAGVVTLVPYFFGEVSLQKKFLMQASMEQHCLHQAKGRATWLGHSDVDEFFELRGPLRSKGLLSYLESLPKDTPGVDVQSQFWRRMRPWVPLVAEKRPFPCEITCKVQGYFPEHARSKWIARPEMIQIIDPHNFATSGRTIWPLPESELRVNHFRHCRKGGPCTIPPWPCDEDDSFADYCTEQLRAEIPKGLPGTWADGAK